jgi:hypothetical protein
MRSFDAIQQFVSNKFHELKFDVTPEEQKLLGLTPEDLASFTEDAALLTPKEIDESIIDIIINAYDGVPAFKALVDEDVADDPNLLAESSGLVGALLKHLRGVLPPEKRTSIQMDTTKQAREIIRDVLSIHMQQPVQAPVPEEKIAPITPQELAYFNLTPDHLTDKTRWWDIKDSVLFFLGKLKGPNGKTVKNEATSKMPGETKVEILVKLLGDIRAKKIAKYGNELSHYDVQFFGKDVRQLKMTARSLVLPAPGKPDPIYVNDRMEVNSQTIDILRRIDRLQEIARDAKFTGAITDLTQALDGALPPVDLFNDRIKNIQEEVSKLGLSKTQVSALVHIDVDSLTYNDPIKKIIEDQRIALRIAQKEVTDKGETPELTLNIKNREKQIKQLEELSAKDTSGIKGAIEDYLGTLRAHRENILKNISGKKLNDAQQKTLDNFKDMLTEMVRAFFRVTREQMFNTLWKAHSGTSAAAPAPVTATTISKMAAVSIPPTSVAPAPSAAPADPVAEKPKGYAAKVQAFRGKGLGDAYLEIQDIIESRDKLPAIKGKLIDILGFKERIETVERIFNSNKSPQQIKEEVYGVTRGTSYGSQIAEIINKQDDLGKLKQVIISILKKDKTVTSMSEGVSHEDIGLADAIKLIERLRSLFKKINIEDKETEALDIIRWAADLPQQIKYSKSKLASAASFIYRVARELLGADDSEQESAPVDLKNPKKGERYQSPSGMGSGATEMPPTGNAQVILYRSRETKMGKKALKSILDTPTFLPKILLEMEKAGFSNRLLEGGKLPPLDLDKLLEVAINKATGESGTLDDILPERLSATYSKEKSIDIKKVKKDLDEAIARRNMLNENINKTEVQYTPKLRSFAFFIENPINAIQEKMEQAFKGKTPEKIEEKDKPSLGYKTERPETITKENFYNILQKLAFKYKGSDKSINLSTTEKGTVKGFNESKSNTASEKFTGIKLADDSPLYKIPSEGVKVLPSEFFKKYLVWKKNLKDSKANVDSNKDAYKRAVALEKYYSIMISFINILRNYTTYQNSVLENDREMIKNINRFISSSEIQGDFRVEKSQEILKSLRADFSNQTSIFEKMKKDDSTLASLLLTAKEELAKIHEDIADKDVKKIYEVAISPELTPDKATERKINERAKEHEKGLSFIIDRSTYKKNMNKITTYKPEKETIVWPDDPKNPTFFPPERKKDIADAIKRAEEFQKRMHAEVDYQHKKLFLDRLKDELIKVNTITKEVKGRVLSFDEALKVVPFDELIKNYHYLSFQQGNKLTTEQIAQMSKDMTMLDNKIPSIFKSVKDMQRKLELAQEAKEENLAEIEKLSVKVRELMDQYNEEAKILENKGDESVAIDPGILEKRKILEEKIPRLQKELEQNRPPEDVKITIDRLTQLLYSFRGLEKHTILKTKSLPEQIKILEEKQARLEELSKSKFNVAPGSSVEQSAKMFKTELDRQIEQTAKDLEIYRNQLSQNIKTASMDDPKSLSDPLENIGKEPPAFIKDLKKPKGWNIVEEFFNNIKREYSFRKGLYKDKNPSIRQDLLVKRLNQLEQVAKAIDAYKKQLVAIDWKAPDPNDPKKIIDYKKLVPFEDTMSKFEETMFEYQDLIKKYTSQRDETEKRIANLQQELDQLSELFEPETGKFKGLGPEKMNSLRRMFFRMLYQDLENMWASNVGKQLSVLGERDTDWYNTVFQTFKNVAGARSNKKMLGIINKYKKETRSEMDDLVNRTKAAELRRDRDDLLRGYKEFDADHEMSSRIKDLNIRIEAVEKQEKQIDQVFKFMGTASIVKMQSDFKDWLRKKLDESDSKVTTAVPEEDDVDVVDVDLTEDVDKELDKALDEIDKAIPVIAQNKIDTDAAKKDLEELKGIREERAPITETAPVSQTPTALPGKMAFDKNHRDFSMNILYGSHMQSKIAEMLFEELK